MNIVCMCQFEWFWGTKNCIENSFNSPKPYFSIQILLISIVKFTRIDRTSLKNTTDKVNINRLVKSTLNSKRRITQRRWETKKKKHYRYYWSYSARISKKRFSKKPMHPFLIKKKYLCQLVGIDQVMKVNKLSLIKRRVEFEMYQRYEIITSHSMRGSFAINDF